ncbi:MAG: hypothetical protein WCK49_05115, partial [Myxococcaceae bacterium]
MKLRLICFLGVFLCSNLVLAQNPVGIGVGAALTASGAVMMVAAGIVAGVASSEGYCDASSQFPDQAIVSFHDCSYKNCLDYYCTQNSVTCYSSDPNDCYYNAGYCDCTVWETVSQTCPDYGCKAKNSSNFAPFLHEKSEPTYSQSLDAIYAGA